MGIPLIDMQDPALVARAYNLGLKIVPNLPHILTSEDLSHWEANLPEMKAVLAKALSRAEPEAPNTEVAKAVKKVLLAWKTISTGATTKEKLIEKIEALPPPVEITGYGKGMLASDAFTISKEAGTADLVILTPRDLGFRRAPRTDAFMTPAFCQKWSTENLDGQVIELCQPEDGPQLRYQYEDQPNGEALWLAMERIMSDGDPVVWYVVRPDSGLFWLDGSWAGPSGAWDRGYRIVFRLRKISAQ